MEESKVIINGDIKWSRGGHLLIDSYPPNGWYELSTKDQFLAIYDVIGQEIKINSIQFKY